MRILITADPMLPVPPTLYGGIERIIADLVGWLRRQGAQVGLVAHPQSTIEVDGLIAWPGDGTSHLGNALALRKAGAQFRPDLNHSFSRLAYLVPAVLAGRRAVMSYQREPTPRTVRWAARLCGSRLQFTGCSEHLARAGAAIGGEWSAIPNFVDPKRLPFVGRVANDAPLVFLSRLDRVKAPHLAIEIARRAGRRLIVAGNHAVNGPEAEYFRSQVEPHFGENGVSYVGPVNDDAKARLLGEAAALLVPVQWEEPFGIVFAEALACGTPILSTPRGALPEIVENGSHGFLSEDMGELVASVARLPALSRAECRARVEKMFSLDTVGARYQRLYEDLLA
jgi:glycosyltransferase involved in cell wall biosynthesis